MRRGWVYVEISPEAHPWNWHLGCLSREKCHHPSPPLFVDQSGQSKISLEGQELSRVQAWKVSTNKQSNCTLGFLQQQRCDLVGCCFCARSQANVHVGQTLWPAH